MRSIIVAAPTNALLRDQGVVNRCTILLVSGTCTEKTSTIGGVVGIILGVISSQRVIMLEMKAVVVALLVIVGCCEQGLALYFHIGETESKCFIEEVPAQTMIVGEE